MMVDIAGVVTYTNFGDHRLRGFWVAGGQISPSPIDFHRRPYNTLALPCERVILSKSVKRLQKYSDLTVFFHNGGRPPSWICWAPIGTTHDEFLMVSIVVQNFVEIDAVVSIT